jgi:hypothetical protein
MTLTEPQFAELIENYAAHIIEGMDAETLEAMVFDLLTREYEKYTEGQIVAEIQELYGDEVAADLIESVGADPETIL